MEGLFVLVAVFNYSVGCVVSYMARWDQSLVMRLIAVLTLFFSIIEFYSAVKTKAHSSQTNKVILRMILLCIFILIEMGITIFVYHGINDVMTTYLLSYGTKGIAGVLLGYAVIKKKLFGTIEKWIEPFCLFFTVFLFSIVRLNVGNSIMSFVIDRQTLSYFGAYLFVLLLFYNFNFSSIEKFKIFGCKGIIWVNILLLVIDLFIVIAGGGRGAFVLVCIAFLYYLVLFSHKSNKLFFIFGIVLLAVFVIVISRFSSIVSISEGYGRIFESFINKFTDRSSQGRVSLWQSAFEYAKERLIIGNGAGSTAYTVGFYSHNLFVDILVDYGLLGIAISLAILIKVFRKVIVLAPKSDSVELLSIILMCGFVMLMFSGSFYSEFSFWFGVTGILGIDWNERKAGSTTTPSAYRK